jgi:DNA-binding MarR family transcriptional regulator
MGNKGVFAMSQKSRVRLTAHSTNISNVILFQYKELSDGAKLTYIILESYDWSDGSGMSKGRCWPSIETLAEARGKSYDTILRHLKELEKAELIRIESGQERGTTNCYWLLEPSQAETERYTQRLPQKAELSVEKTAAQESDPTYRESATLPVAKMLHHEESRLKNPKEPDSNPPMSVRVPNFSDKKFTSNAKTTLNIHSPYLTRLMDDFSRALNDTSHANSNRTQVLRIFHESGLPERTFGELLYEAKKRTQWANLAGKPRLDGGPNRAAYFFRVVRDLVATRAVSKVGCYTVSKSVH